MSLIAATAYFVGLTVVAFIPIFGIPMLLWLAAS